MPMRLKTPAETALDAARTALADAERALLAEKVEQKGARLAQKSHAYVTGPAAKVIPVRRLR